MRSVERLASRDALPGYGARVAEMASSLFAGGLEPIVIGGFVARLNDRLLGRILRMAEADLGAPPTPYAWLAFGSEGRMGQGAPHRSGQRRSCTARTRPPRAPTSRASRSGRSPTSGGRLPSARRLHGDPLARAARRVARPASTAGSRRRRPPRCSRRRSSSTSARCTATSTWPRSTLAARAGGARTFLSAMAKSALTFRPPGGLVLRIREDASGGSQAEGHQARSVPRPCTASGRGAHLEHAGPDPRVRRGAHREDTLETLTEAYGFLCGCACASSSG